MLNRQSPKPISADCVLLDTQEMANVLPAAIGATIVAAGAYCELPPPTRSPASPLRGCPAKLRVVGPLLWSQLPLRSRLRALLALTRALARRRGRSSCADTPQATMPSCPIARRPRPSFLRLAAAFRRGTCQTLRCARRQLPLPLGYSAHLASVALLRTSAGPHAPSTAAHVLTLYPMLWQGLRLPTTRGY